MVDLLALTLTQREPEQDTGESAGFHWQWLGEGCCSARLFRVMKNHFAFCRNSWQ